VTILFFNDLHGHLMPFEVKTDKGRQELGGMARMATLIRGIRAENSRRNVRTLVLVAGDLLQGTPMSTVFRGEPDVACLNAMGVDAVAIGNHEFDFGLENFRRLQGLAAFPFLSANVVKKAGGGPIARPFLSIPLGDGLAVTVIGATTGELLTISKADNVEALAIADPLLSVRQAYEQVRSQGPVVLLSHNRHRIDRQIAAALPELAAVIGGHDHILLSPPAQVGAVPIFEALEKGLFLGRIDLTVDAVSKKARLVGHAYIPVTSAVTPDPQVAAILAPYQEQLGGRFKEVIGRAEGFLDGERRHIRYQETSLGNFVADAMADHTGAPLALINAGALRASLQTGPVTVEDVFRVVPFANELVVIELTGEEIERALARSVSGSRGDEDGGFLQVSGISFAVRGRSVSNIRLGREKQPLEPRKVYRVATSEFLAGGGDRYTFLKDKPQVKTGLPLAELLIDTIRRQGAVAAATEGRIRRLD
jgi:2',3'-cyclic-nucleotide 2'-phosphodiesterase (5'-nucleotidase family)